jgi:hypothetical protein
MNDWVRAAWLAKHPGPFKVGDRVRYVRAGGPVEGVIVEDRGPLGVGGRRIYALRVRRDEWNEVITEQPEDELQLVAETPKDDSNGQQV